MNRFATMAVSVTFVGGLVSLGDGHPTAAAADVYLEHVTTVTGVVAIPCPGDCNGDGFVRIGDLIIAVNVAIGIVSPAACRVADGDNDGTVRIQELIAAVGAALDGCPQVESSPTPTPTPRSAAATATPTGSRTPGEFIFGEGFEEGDGAWFADNGVWEIGEPSSGSVRCPVGGRCAATVLDGDYPNTNSSLVSPSITLPAIDAREELHLRFWHWFSFAEHQFGVDEGRIYVQEQTAPGVWSEPTLLTGYAGSSGGVWTRPSVDLSAYAAKRVRVLFSLLNGPYADVADGWYIDEVIVSVVAAAATAPYTDGFENGLGHWWAHNGTWQIGAATTGPGGCYGGSAQCAATVLDGNYPNTNSSLVSPSFALPTVDAGEEIHLRFWHWFSFAEHQFGVDEGRIYIEEQTGPRAWSAATLLTGYAGYSGAVWTRPSVDLSAYAGKTVRISFSLINGPYADTSVGWYIDDVSIAVVLANDIAPFADGFENGLRHWWAHNGTWQVGAATTGPGSCYGGSGQCAATVLDGNYPNTNSSLVSPSIALPTIDAGEEIHLRFWHWFSFAEHQFGVDEGRIYIEEQTGPAAWSAATVLTGYTGVSGGVWTRPLVDLSAYAGKKVRISFSLVNGPYADTSVGWYIDDVSVAVQ
jgi:bacillopeptidase F (M6 metalloprotease family)